MLTPIVVDVRENKQFVVVTLSDGRRYTLSYKQRDFIATHFIERFYINTDVLEGQDTNTVRSLRRLELVKDTRFNLATENGCFTCREIRPNLAILAMGLNEATHFGFKTQEGPLCVALDLIRTGEYLWGDAIGNHAIDFMLKMEWIHPPKGDIIMLSPEGHRITKGF